MSHKVNDRSTHIVGFLPILPASAWFLPQIFLSLLGPDLGVFQVRSEKDIISGNLA